MTNKIDFFQVKNETNDSVDLYFYGDIVGSDAQRMEYTDQAPENVLSFLNYVDENKVLNIYVNSGGGNVFAGLAIYNILKRAKNQKVVHVDGLAGSIASVIALAGDVVKMPANSYFMIHKPLLMAQGNATELRKVADDLDQIEKSIMQIYGENMADGVELKQIQKLVDAETWLVASDAAKLFGKIQIEEENKAVAFVESEFLNTVKSEKFAQLLSSSNKTVKEDQKEKEKLVLALELLQI